VLWATSEPFLRIARVSLPTFGRSPIASAISAQSPGRKTVPAFGIETHAADLVAFVEALGIGPVHVVAWSYAGHAALRAAQLRPDLFSAMLIYETGFQTFMTDKAEISAFKADLNEMFAPILAAASEGRLADAARLVIDGSAGEAGYFDRQSQRSRMIALENAHMLPLLLNQTPPPRISADELKALKVPVTIACGERTRPAYRLVSEAAMRILPGPHHVIAGASHFWPDAEPEAFCGLVRDWGGDLKSQETQTIPPPEPVTAGRSSETLAR
jgi:pimeloyl-ACP methyl ester carboxylesterase